MPNAINITFEDAAVVAALERSARPPGRAVEIDAAADVERTHTACQRGHRQPARTGVTRGEHHGRHDNQRKTRSQHDSLRVSFLKV